MPHTDKKASGSVSDKVQELRDIQLATLNILEDFNSEKLLFADTYRAALNIIEDFDEEKDRMAQTQRALLNILDDFEEEKNKVEMAREQLQAAHDVLEMRVEERTSELTNSLQEKEALTSQLRTSLREKEVLIKEVYHRTKNNMHIITNLITLQTRSIIDKEMVGTMRDLQRRIQAMALVHEKLYKSGDLSNLDLRDYITDLTKALTGSYLNSGRNVAIELSLEKVIVSIDAAIPCGLIINELISNCMKYAFPPERGGVIRLSLRRLDRTEIELRVADDGKGLPDGIDIRKASTLGLKIVYSLVMQLSGTIDARSGRDGGAEFIIRFAGDEI